MQMPTTASTPAPQSAARPFHPGLEGLRGIAVIAVLLFHDGVTWMQGGFLGVSTFFTLSGFLITGLLVSEFGRTGRIDLPRFWGRRFRRLMPAALLTLFGVSLFGLGAADATQYERLLGDGFSALFYVANWWLIASDVGYADLMGSPSPIQHFWSLAIEEQYYVLYPIMAVGGLVLAGLSRRVLGGILAAIMASAWVWMAWLAMGDVSNARIYYGTDTRCAELLAGGILALALVDRPIPERSHRLISFLGILGLGVSGWFWTVSSTEDIALYTGDLVLYTAASVAVIAAAILPGGPVRRLLSGRILRWVGRVSYGIYLIHWPLYLWLSPERTGLDGVPLALLRLASTAALAAASYYWLEEPIRTGRRIVGWQRWVAPPVAATLVAVAFALVTRWTPFSDEAVVPMDAPTPTATRDPDAPPVRILVLGDSVGHNIGQGLSEWAEQTGHADVMNRARTGCGIARGGHLGGPSRTRRICDNWQRGFERPLDEHRPDLVLVYSAGFDLHDRKLDSWTEPRAIGDPVYDQWMRSEYEAATALFSRDGARVVWISPLCLGMKPGLKRNSPLDPKRTRLLTNNVVKPLARESRTADYLDLYHEVCPNDEFTNEFAGISNFRPDGIHFSERGRIWVGRWVGERLVTLFEAAAHETSRQRRESGESAKTRPSP